MTTLKIDSFGGEMPSVSPRALPPQAAQTNSNLFLATSEFRPLSEDFTVAAAPLNTNSVYRFARTPAGDLNTNTATGWVTSTKVRNYVKGQINDERTERTYFTVGDGSEPMKAITAANPTTPRLVGVPAPMKPTATVVVTDELTPDEANDHINKVAIHEIHKILLAGINNPSNVAIDEGRRTLAGLPAAGSFQLWGMYWTDHPVLQGVYADKPYYAVAVFPYTAAEKMNLLIGEMDGRGLPLGNGPYTNAAIPVIGVPFAYWLNTEVVRANLRTVVFPATGFGAKSGQRVLTEAQITDLLVKTIKWFTADTYARAQREKLDAEIQAFVKLLVAAPDGSHATVMAMRSRIAAATHDVNVKSVERLKQFSEDTIWVKEWVDSKGGPSAFVGTTTQRSIETRFYVATFVTDWDEESAPSEPTAELELDQNDSVTVLRPDLPPSETFAGRNINRWRIYRSNSGGETASFQFTEELNINTTSYLDTKKAAALGEVCPTTTWAMPPKRETGTNPHIRGLVGMPNGIMVGFFDNTLAFCEPYVPYAWPVEYQITTEFPVVGLGVFGQTVFVGTKGNPYFVHGADSASMSAVKLDARQSCASARSITTVQGGVLYASPDGLCLADPNGVRLISSAFFTREDWQKLVPETMVAASHENICYMFYEGNGGGCISFDAQAAKLGRLNLSAAAAFSDTVTDTLYVVNGTEIRAVFGAATRRTGTWKSPRITLPRYTSFSWLKVYGNQTLTAPVVVRLFGDDTLVHTVSISDTSPVRLPDGRRLEYEIEIESRSRVTRVIITSDTQELQAV